MVEKSVTHSKVKAWTTSADFFSGGVPIATIDDSFVISLLTFRANKACYTQVPGCIEQSVTCLATDANLTADPGVASSIPARSHTFMEIDYEITSTVFVLPSAESFKKGCCQLQAIVCAQSTG